MKWIISLILLAVVSVAWAEEEASFVYDDHGRRDPFWRLVSPSGAVLNYDSDLLISDMVLEGIIADPSGKSVAIINSMVVKPNDKIGLFVVSEIEQDKVILNKGEESFVLKLKKEE